MKCTRVCGLLAPDVEDTEDVDWRPRGILVYLYCVSNIHRNINREADAAVIASRQTVRFPCRDWAGCARIVSSRQSYRSFVYRPIPLLCNGERPPKLDKGKCIECTVSHKLLLQVSLALRWRHGMDGFQIRMTWIALHRRWRCEPLLSSARVQRLDDVVH